MSIAINYLVEIKRVMLCCCYCCFEAIQQYIEQCTVYCIECKRWRLARMCDECS